MYLLHEAYYIYVHTVYTILYLYLKRITSISFIKLTEYAYVIIIDFIIL